MFDNETTEAIRELATASAGAFMPYPESDRRVIIILRTQAQAQAFYEALVRCDELGQVMAAEKEASRQLDGG